MLTGYGPGAGTRLEPARHGNGVAPASIVAVGGEAANKPVQLDRIQTDAGDFAPVAAEYQLATLALVTDFNLGEQLCRQAFWCCADSGSIRLSLADTVKGPGVLHREQFVLQASLSQALVTLSVLNLFAQGSQQATGQATCEQEDPLGIRRTGEEDNTILRRVMLDGE
jgi:hypothetical protein